MSGQPISNLLRHVRRLVEPPADHLPDRQLLERFTARHEEAAFAALVQRHGPIVLHVCRRVLHDPADAEDAFQATFLVLVRKAAAIRKLESLGCWLYGVAHRLARKARVEAARRRTREQSATRRPPADLLAEVTGRELCAALDDELQRLPERYRAPLVLCYLEGQTRDEAARQLGWSLGTFKRRLEGGRNLLRARLARRGVTLPAALLPALALPGPAAAAVPALLAEATLQAATAFAAREATAG